MDLVVVAAAECSCLRFVRRDVLLTSAVERRPLGCDGIDQGKDAAPARLNLKMLRDEIRPGRRARCGCRGRLPGRQ
jgi:hypothetical protein